MLASPQPNSQPNSKHKQIPLRFVLIVPFALQIFAAVGLVGYFSFRNGQQAINNLAQQLQQEVGTRVNDRLNTYLELPQQLNQLNLDAIDQGALKLNDLESAGRYFWKQSKIFSQFSYLGYSLTDRTGGGAGRWLKGENIVITHHLQGGLKDYTYRADGQGNRQQLVDATEYDPIAADWYVETVKARKPIWSQIYAAEGFENYVAASANAPIFDQNRKVIGVLGIDLLLSDISAFLRSIQINSGKILIMERDGQLIASSSEQPITHQVKDQTERLGATSIW